MSPCSLPPRFQRGRDGEEREEREEGRDTFPSLPEDRGLREGYRTDRELASSWVVGQGERGRRESHESGGRDTSGVSDWSAEVEEDFERRSQVGNFLLAPPDALHSPGYTFSN